MMTSSFPTRVAQGGAAEEEDEEAISGWLGCACENEYRIAGRGSPLESVLPGCFRLRCNPNTIADARKRFSSGG